VIPLSVLDLVPITQGGSAGEALRQSLDLARHAEGWGYRRYWVAEHHNMPGIASSATAVVMGYIAGGTRTIRVGSGGIMLPNHAPLVVAEQIGTLAALYPGRIDLGLGRAPGTDQMTARALRRDLAANAESFPRDVLELQALLGPARPEARIRAVPGEDSDVPIWLLGSSLYSAQLAALLGLPFAFASHFAPDALFEALALYRSRFQPSDQLAEPYVMLGAHVVAADREEEARRLFTSLEQSFANLVRGMPGRLPPPVEDSASIWRSPAEEMRARHMLRYAFVGTPETVRAGLQGFIDETGADEVMVSGAIHDHAARLRSFEIAAEAARGVEARRLAA